MTDWRGFLIATTVKKRWFRKDIIEIEITDGENSYTFKNTGSFTVPTDIPFPEPLIKQDIF